jgi:hypothetical protein
MLMPGHPRVGDVFRPENTPGLVFEVATVTATGLTVAGPRGPVTGAVRIQNLELDGSIEQKIFAPRYGEFQASVASTGEFYDVALAIPADRLSRPTPRRLTAITGEAGQTLIAAGHRDWCQISHLTHSMKVQWAAHRQRVHPPAHLAAQLSNALRRLDKAVATHNVAATRQAALDVGKAGVDLKAQYEPVKTTDRARYGLWRQQLHLDIQAANPAFAAGDKAVLAAIAARLHD